MLAAEPKPRFRIGITVTGRVVKSVRFGVFVDIGLPHLALIDLTCMEKPEVNGFPKVGETVSAVIVDLTDDGNARLSLRQKN